MTEKPRVDAFGKQFYDDKYTGMNCEHLWEDLARQLERENRELREALEFYAVESNYYEACLPLQNDSGNKARAILSRLKGL